MKVKAQYLVTSLGGDKKETWMLHRQIEKIENEKIEGRLGFSSLGRVVSFRHEISFFLSIPFACFFFFFFFERRVKTTISIPVGLPCA